MDVINETIIINEPQYTYGIQNSGAFVGAAHLGIQIESVWVSKSDNKHALGSPSSKPPCDRIQDMFQ